MVTQDIVITFYGKNIMLRNCEESCLLRNAGLRGCYDAEGIIKFLIRLIMLKYFEFF